MRKALGILCITIALLFTGCREVGRSELAAPRPSFSPNATSMQNMHTPAPTPWRVPVTPSPTPKPPLQPEEVDTLRRCLNNAIYRHIYYRTDARLKFEKYDKQQIIVRLYDYFDTPPNWCHMVFSVSGDYFSFGIDRDYLNGPVVNSFGTRDEEAMLRLEQKECDGEFTFNFDPNPEYDFESQYFNRWPEIRDKIINLETERWTKYGRDEYWLRFFLYTEEYAMKPKEARVYFIIESTETPFIDVLKANVYEDGSVSYGWAVDATDATLKYYRTKVFDEVKITIP